MLVYDGKSAVSLLSLQYVQETVWQAIVNIHVKPSARLLGEAGIPGSKSHTIRAVVIASLASGTSRILSPLESADTEAALRACEALGARVQRRSGEWLITGCGGKLQDPGRTLFMANSGTSLNLLTGVCALAPFPIVLDGDESLRRRPIQPLLDALTALGAEAISLRHNSCCPVRIRGPLRGGRTSVDGANSQHVSALLFTTPLASADTEISVTNLHEAPYVRMTLSWLQQQGIQYSETGNLTRFRVQGGQRYTPFERTIPADWSSATFPIVAAALLPGSDVVLTGLDPEDVQGDTRVIKHVQSMGGRVEIDRRRVRIFGTPLHGTEIDLDETPDALPALAVLACRATGETRLTHVGHARIKETDRLTVMQKELSRMGADVQELADGLVIQGGRLRGTTVNGHSDHRVVMALAIAGLAAEGCTTVTTGEAVRVTFPEFVPLMRHLGACITTEE